MYKNIFSKPIRPIPVSGISEEEIKTSEQYLRAIEAKGGDPINLRPQEAADKIKEFLAYRKLDKERIEDIIYQLDVSDPAAFSVYLKKLPESKIAMVLELDAVRHWSNLYGGMGALKNKQTQGEELSIREEVLLTRAVNIYKLV